MMEMHTYLFAVEYNLSSKFTNDKNPLRDYGICHGISNEDVIRQLMSEVYDETDISTIYLFKVSNKNISFIPHNLWIQLKEHLMD